MVYYVTHGHHGKLKKKAGLTLTEEVTTSVHTTTRDGVDMRDESRSKVSSLSEADGGSRGGRSRGYQGIPGMSQNHHNLTNKLELN